MHFTLVMSLRLGLPVGLALQKRVYITRNKAT